jgi:hypothetical protein
MLPLLRKTKPFLDLVLRYWLGWFHRTLARTDVGRFCRKCSDRSGMLPTKFWQKPTETLLFGQKQNVPKGVIILALKCKNKRKSPTECRGKPNANQPCFRFVGAVGIGFNLLKNLTQNIRKNRSLKKKLLMLNF